MGASARKSFQLKSTHLSFLSWYGIKGFPGPARPELVALMHLSSGRREDELQGFASLREMVFGTVREEGEE